MTHPSDSSCADYFGDISFEEIETFIARTPLPLQVSTPETRGPTDQEHKLDFCNCVTVNG